MAAVNMTEGGIGRHLIHYAVPLILGNLFQLTYNAVDSIIAGRFIGKEALAAEGTASPVMNIIILGISGIRFMNRGKKHESTAAYCDYFRWQRALGQGKGNAEKLRPRSGK